MARKRDGADGGGEQKPYVVLARKYRPETFADLIGQEAMVRTLTNAFRSDRIAQAYMLTGVRGVGKTTTARILARALNYVRPDLPDRPTVEMDGYGAHCQEIIQSRHPDVIEMDAASNTGVDNVREIIEGARYRPLSARYKVYIIDEVHMLSKSAFNALLKTLEEPPGHVKFIFATTEIRRVPVTVLSRCQRFDLRRVDVAELARHFAGIVKAEGAKADDDALRLIARAAGGSVRDGLSILDQAIAMGSGKVTTPAVRAMLGLADRGRVFDLLEQVLGGDAKAALGGFAGLHGDGAEPPQVLADMAELVHACARIKVAGEAGSDDALSAEERARAASIAGRLSVGLLSRAWQILLKGVEEAGRAQDSAAAAEMVLIRLAHTADLPSPEELIRMLDEGAVAPPAARSDGGGGEHGNGGPRAALSQAGGSAAAKVAMAQQPRAAPTDPVAAGPASWAEVIALAGAERDAKLMVELEDHVSLVAFEPGRIELFLGERAPRGLAGELGAKLSRWTGMRWIISLGREPGERPLGELRREREAAAIEAMRRHPAVEAVLEIFPEAKVERVKRLDDDGAEN